MAGGNTNHTRLFSTLRGGIAVHNPNSDANVPGGAYGTLGFIATSNGTDRWIVSCYHVLCRKGDEMPAGVVEPIFHPFSQLQPSPVATVSNDRASRDLDCAAASIVSGRAVGEILGIGTLAPASDPALGMRVIKSGAETGVTEGRIVNLTNTEVEISPLGLPDDYELSEGGDSGSLWIDAATLSPVALHYKGSDRGTPERAFGKPIKVVLEALRLRILA
jgi:hypothetical protein